MKIPLNIVLKIFCQNAVEKKEISVTHSDYMMFEFWWIFLLWTLSGIQAQTGEGDPGPEGTALTSNQSSRRTPQIFKLTEVWPRDQNSPICYWNISNLLLDIWSMTLPYLIHESVCVPLCVYLWFSFCLQKIIYPHGFY